MADRNRTAVGATGRENVHHLVTSRLARGRLMCVALLLLSTGTVSCTQHERSQAERVIEGVGRVLVAADEAARRQLHVAVLNVEIRHDVDAWEQWLTRPWSQSDETSRLRKLAGLLRQHFPQWSIVGMQELYYQRDRVFGAGSFFHVELDDKSISDCGAPRHERGFAADCFGSYLGTRVREQRRAVGVVADNRLWELIPWPSGDVQSRSRIGEERFTLIHRTVMGVRLRNTLSGIVVPIWATHLSATDDQERQREELTDLARVVKDRHVVGDMPPVIVGDFNCGSWTQPTRDLIYRDFQEATGMAGVLLVFVGRPQSFPEATAFWRLERWPGPTPADLRAPLREFMGKELGVRNGERLWELTDHPMATATLTADYSMRPADVAWPHDASTIKGCLPLTPA